jgi:hypothetical protein
MTAMVIEEDVWTSAGQVTVAMLGLMLVALALQGMYKLSVVTTAVRKKEKIERYTDPRLLIVDRAVYNLLEWLPVFLGLFWISMIATGGQTVTWGWVYVLFRALYPPLALSGGLSAKLGPKYIILWATAPAYVALIALLLSCIRELFL